MTETTSRTDRSAAQAGGATPGEGDAEAARKAIAESYLKALDAGGTSPTTGLGLFEHFTEDAEVYFPKWGVARGMDRVQQLFGDVGGTLRGISHHYDRFTWYMTGTDSFAVEGTSDGAHRDGEWIAGDPDWGAGRFCDCFTVRDGKIARLFIYLDPDYAGNDTARYDWIDA